MCQYLLKTLRIVLILLVIHAAFGFNYDIYFTGVHKILNFISQYPELYIIHFQATNNFVSINYPFSSFMSCCPCTFLLFPPAYHSNATMGRIQNWYKPKYNIILVENMEGGARVCFNKFAMHPTAIYFMYFSHHDHLIYLLDALTPATKIRILRLKKNSKCVDFGTPYCDG